MVETVTVRAENVTLDLLLWRKFGVRGRELVEATLERNPGLANGGIMIPLLTVVTIPDLPARSTTVAKPLTLFG